MTMESSRTPDQCRRRALVLCLLNGWCFAARDFRSRRGARDEHITEWIWKERATKPGPKRPAALRVAPRSAGGFVARRSQPHFGGCSLLAPRHRPTWGQQNTSHLGDTTLAPRARGAELQSARTYHTPERMARLWTAGTCPAFPAPEVGRERWGEFKNLRRQQDVKEKRRRAAAVQGYP